MLRQSGAVREDDLASGMPSHGIPEQNLGILDPTRYELAIHGTPQDAVNWGLLTEGQALAYDLFVFLRDPFDRYVSACAHKRLTPLDQSAFEQLVRSGAPKGQVVRRQSEYIKVNGVEVVTPLDFRHYESEARRLLLRAGGEGLSAVPRMNQSLARERKLAYYSAATRQRIHERFSEDFALYERFFGMT